MVGFRGITSTSDFQRLFLWVILIMIPSPKNHAMAIYKRTPLDLRRHFDSKKGG